MSILEDLVKELRVDGSVEDVLVGVHWTMVQVRQGDGVLSGLASTVLAHGPHGESQVREAGHLESKTVRALVEYALSTNPLEVSIGLAALNAVLSRNAPPSVSLNAANWLEEHGRGRRIAIVGRFPFVPRLRSAAKSLWVIEQNPVDDEIPAERAAEFLAQADVIAITGMAIVNNTIDNLLRACRPESHIMILGPSTPLTPRLFDYGIEVLSGARVLDADAARRGILQGAHLHQIEGLELVTVTRPTPMASARTIPE